MNGYEHGSCLYLQGPSFFAVVTLLDSLDPKECNWLQLQALLQEEFQLISNRDVLLDLIVRIKASMEFCRIVSKFLMDRHRAGSLWVNAETYENLASRFLRILCDK